MATLVTQLENITATEDDDYFTPDYKLELLNRAKDHIIERGIQVERSREVSLRFLDQLRVKSTLSLNTFSSFQDFYTTTADKPNDLDDWISLSMDEMNLSELNKLYEVRHGNAIPSAEEGYFLVYGNEFEFYLDKDSYSSVNIRYIKSASDISSTDTSIDDLGEGAERVVLYHAATLMGDTDVTIPSQLFKDEFNQYFGDLL